MGVKGGLLPTLDGALVEIGAGANDEVQDQMQVRLWKLHRPDLLRLTKRSGKTFVTVREAMPEMTGPNYQFG